MPCDFIEDLQQQAFWDVNVKKFGIQAFRSQMRIVNVERRSLDLEGRVGFADIWTDANLEGVNFSKWFEETKLVEGLPRSVGDLVGFVAEERRKAFANAVRLALSKSREDQTPTMET